MSQPKALEWTGLPHPGGKGAVGSPAGWLSNLCFVYTSAISGHSWEQPWRSEQTCATMRLELYSLGFFFVWACSQSFDIDSVLYVSRG